MKFHDIQYLPTSGFSLPLPPDILLSSLFSNSHFCYDRHVIREVEFQPDKKVQLKLCFCELRALLLQAENFKTSILN
jgi:hypothetical protein